MVRVSGVEPLSPGYQPSVLTVVLHAHVKITGIALPVSYTTRLTANSWQHAELELNQLPIPSLSKSLRISNLVGKVRFELTNL